MSTDYALPIARQAVSLYPQNPYIRDTAGWTSFLADNRDEAMLHLREAVRLAPQQGASHYHLAKLLLAQQHREEAEGGLRRALECGLPDEEKREAQTTLGGK